MTLTKWGTLITSDYLQKNQACPRQVKKFKEDFPDGLKLTPYNLTLVADKKYHLGFLLYWLAREEHEGTLGSFDIRHRHPALNDILDTVMHFSAASDMISSWGMIPSIVVLLDKRAHL